MPTHIFEPSVSQVIADAQQAARDRRTKPVVVDAATRQVRTPFPSPGDWRDTWIYFLLIDRFNNPAQPPNGAWNRRFDFRQGGTFDGVQAQLGYLAAAGRQGHLALARAEEREARTGASTITATASRTS